MNSTNKQKLPVGAIVVLIAAAGVACFGVIQALKPKGGASSRLPYQYDIEKLREVAPELIKWKETNMHPVGGVATAIAIDGNDRVFVAADMRIDVLDLAGRRSQQIPISSPATALATAADGTIYAGLTDHVVVFKPDGHQSMEWQSMGEKSMITSIAVGPKDVFVADSGNRTVWRYDRSGSLISSCRGPEKGGFSIPSAYFDVLLQGDKLLIVDTGRQDIGTYDFDFKRQSGWGKAGESITGFAGCCNPSHIAQLPDGAIVTAEKGLPRIKVFESNGKLREVVAPPTLLTDGAKPCDIAVASTGAIYALDLNSGKIRVFNRVKETEK